VIVFIAVPSSYSVTAPSSWITFHSGSGGTPYNLSIFGKLFTGGSEIATFTTSAPSSQISVIPVAIKRGDINRVRVGQISGGSGSSPARYLGYAPNTLSNSLMLVTAAYTSGGTPPPFPGTVYELVSESMASNFSHSVVASLSSRPFTDTREGMLLFGSSITAFSSVGIEIDSSEKLADRALVLSMSLGSSTQNGALAFKVDGTTINRVRSAKFSSTQNPWGPIEVSPSGRAVAIPRGGSPSTLIFPWREEFGQYFSLSGTTLSSTGITSIRFSPSEKAIVFGWNGSPPNVRAYRWRWGIGSAYPEISPVPSMGTIYDMAFHPSGSLIALAGTGPESISVYGWNDATGFGGKIFADASSGVLAHSCSWSPDGTWLVVGVVYTASSQKAILVYKKTGSSISLHQAHVLPNTGGALIVRFSPDGSYLLASGVGASNNAKIYNWTASGLGSEAVSSLPHQISYYFGGEWSRDGKYVAFVESTQQDLVVYPFSGGILGTRLTRVPPLRYGSENGEKIGAVAWIPSEITDIIASSSVSLEARGFVVSQRTISIESRPGGATAQMTVSVEFVRAVLTQGAVSIESDLNLSRVDLAKATERNLAFNSVLRRFP
jgi:WD40 repeat protein